MKDVRETVPDSQPIPPTEYDLECYHYFYPNEYLHRNLPPVVKGRVPVLGLFLSKKFKVRDALAVLHVKISGDNPFVPEVVPEIDVKVLAKMEIFNRVKDFSKLQFDT
jgi:hypothetical protein